MHLLNFETLQLFSVVILLLVTFQTLKAATVTPWTRITSVSLFDSLELVQPPLWNGPDTFPYKGVEDDFESQYLLARARYAIYPISFNRSKGSEDLLKNRPEKEVQVLETLVGGNQAQIYFLNADSHIFSSQTLETNLVWQASTLNRGDLCRPTYRNLSLGLLPMIKRSGTQDLVLASITGGTKLSVINNKNLSKIIQEVATPLSSVTIANYKIITRTEAPVTNASKYTLFDWQIEAIIILSNGSVIYKNNTATNIIYELKTEKVLELQILETAEKGSSLLELVVFLRISSKVIVLTINSQGVRSATSSQGWSEMIPFSYRANSYIFDGMILVPKEFEVKNTSNPLWGCYNTYTQTFGIISEDSFDPIGEQGENLNTILTYERPQDSTTPILQGIPTLFSYTAWGKIRKTRIFLNLNTRTLQMFSTEIMYKFATPPVDYIVKGMVVFTENWEEKVPSKRNNRLIVSLRFETEKFYELYQNIEMNMMAPSISKSVNVEERQIWNSQDHNFNFSGWIQHKHWCWVSIILSVVDFYTRGRVLPNPLPVNNTWDEVCKWVSDARPGRPYYNCCESNGTCKGGAVKRITKVLFTNYSIEALTFRSISPDYIIPSFNVLKQEIDNNRPIIVATQLWKPPKTQKDSTDSNTDQETVNDDDEEDDPGSDTSDDEPPSAADEPYWGRGHVMIIYGYAVSSNPDQTENKYVLLFDPSKEQAKLNRTYLRIGYEELRTLPRRKKRSHSSEISVRRISKFIFTSPPTK